MMLHDNRYRISRLISAWTHLIFHFGVERKKSYPIIYYYFLCLFLILTVINFFFTNFYFLLLRPPLPASSLHLPRMESVDADGPLPFNSSFATYVCTVHSYYLTSLVSHILFKNQFDCLLLLYYCYDVFFFALSYVCGVLIVYDYLIVMLFNFLFYFNIIILMFFFFFFFYFISFW